MPSDYIARVAVELPPLADLEATPGALDALSEIIGSARIVAIGESFHHTCEQLVLREHLVRHLVSQLGFTTILLEVVTPGPNAIDAYIRGGVGDGESALIAAGARMWRNTETAMLVRWLRAYNQTRANAPVTVQGLDVLAIGPLMRAVMTETRAAGWERVEGLSYGFDTDGRADQAAYNQLSPEDRAMLHGIFAAAGPESEAALVVRAALEMLEAGAEGWTKGFALRDRAMADAASRLIDRSGADAKVIILSHNTHIAAAASVTEPSHKPMGALLRERYGAAYFALGTAFGRARFDPPIYGVGEFAGEPSSADQAIARLGYATALVDLRGAQQAQALRLQGVGVGALPYTEYPSLSAFDALAYVDQITNARQLVETELGLDASAVDATRR